MQFVGLHKPSDIERMRSYADVVKGVKFERGLKNASPSKIIPWLGSKSSDNADGADDANGPVASRKRRVNTRSKDTGNMWRKALRAKVKPLAMKGSEHEDQHFESFFCECTKVSISCSIAKTHKHCKLCDKIFDTPYHCKRHFFQSHASRAVVYDGSYCYPCKKAHTDNVNIARAHYHCPFCGASVINKEPFLNHLRSHAQKKRVAKEIPETARTNLEGSKDVPLQTKTSENEPEKAPKSRKTTLEKAECPICGKAMHVKSINRHCRVQHDIETSSATCVDDIEGLFLIRNSSKGGVSYPVHVRKVLSGENIGVACEVVECMDTMGVAWRSGITTAECHHLTKVGKNPAFPEKVSLNMDLLDDLSKTGTFKLFTDDRIESCKQAHGVAEKNNKNLIVPMQDCKRFIHFSVFHGEINYFSRFGRVAVTADLLKGTLDCRCSRRKVSCIHKCLVLWFLHQNELLGTFRGEAANDQNCNSISKDNCQTVTETDSSEEKTVYPPTEPDVLSKMCNYLYKEKRVPMDLSHINTLAALPIRRFVPVETQCHYCTAPLGLAIRITNRAIVLTMQDLYVGVETYFKKCTQCAMPYRYQEHKQHLHNFNDNFLIGLDVCKFLRESLQQHLPIGSVVNVLQNQLGKSINSQTVLEAYLHFESMSSHAYTYNCALCGYHPKILIMDLNKKVAFDCPQANLELPEDYDPNEADSVDSDVFWRKVEMSMILRGFPNRVVPDFVIHPNLLSWAPFIGKQTRKNEFLMNTEHRKVKRVDGEMEADCRDITEERLLEILNNSTAKEVKSFSKSIGCTPSGSKLDMILRIRNAISKNDATFKKAFSKYWGCSGGWVSATCPHGIIYALKFVLRAESPRDYIDILESMAHQPNIVVSDMANMLVAHGNKRRVGMFQPFNGMIVEPTTDNIELALEGKLSVSFPWLGEKDHCNLPSNISGAHPVSGSAYRLCLFDRFHEKNAKKDCEVLRRIPNVVELRGKLNSQKDEQLHSVYNHDRRYLNQMTPVNHIFLFRSNVDVKNEKKNAHLLEKLQSFKFEIEYDLNGRAVINKEKPISSTGNLSKNNKRPRKHEDDAEANDLKKQKNESYNDSQVPSPVSVVSVESHVHTIPHNEPDVVSDDALVPSPISVASVDSCEDTQSTNDVDSYWIEDLGLKMRDRRCILDGNWLNDRIINAAMTLMKERNPSMKGLLDVIVATRFGYNDTGCGKFSQILNVRGCHWLTISNAMCIGNEVEIYDSLHSLNLRKGKKISYPIALEQAACALAKPKRQLLFTVLDVQQQEGGSDCGLFAIAFAQILCSGGHPSKYLYLQHRMREELVTSLEARDIQGYVDEVAVRDVDEERCSLYEFHCNVHCYCRMPDDGKLMINCPVCKRWFHEDCVEDDYNPPNWKCLKCDKSSQEDMDLRKLLGKFRKAAAKNSKDTQNVQTLYNAIVSILASHKFPDTAKRHIACFTGDEYNTIAPQKEQQALGLTFPGKSDFFIVIFHERIKTDEHMLTVVLHEIAHVLDRRHPDRDGKAHGKSFRKIAKSIAEEVLSKMNQLPKPYDSVILDPKEVQRH